MTLTNKQRLSAQIAFVGAALQGAMTSSNHEIWKTRGLYFSGKSDEFIVQAVDVGIDAAREFERRLKLERKLNRKPKRR